MAFSTASALRSSLRFARASRPTVARPQLLRRFVRRGYASSHGEVKSGGDLVWAVGAVAVTIPTCYYLLTSIDTAGHDDHGEAHGEHHGDEDEDEHKEDVEGEGEDEKSTGSEGNAEEKSEDSEQSGSEDEKDSDTPETSDDEGGDEHEVQDGHNTKKHVPDAKGGAKKRLESNNSENLGDNPTGRAGDDDRKDPKDPAYTSKPAGGQNTMSGKQEGLSNTNTKHAKEDHEGLSQKGPGQPETAKSKGTITPKDTPA